jgi:hypothetical protein
LENELEELKSSISKHLEEEKGSTKLPFNDR